MPYRISARFEPGFRKCDILLDGELFEGLRVKKIGPLTKYYDYIWLVIVPAAPKIAIAYDLETMQDCVKGSDNG